MSGQGKNKLIAYVAQIQARLVSITESGDTPAEDEATKIVTNVVNSLKRLSAGAPGEIRGAIKDALASNGCLSGPEPNPEAGITELSAALAGVADALGIPQEDDSEDPPKPFQPPEAEDPHPPVDTTPGDEAATLAGVVSRLWEIEEPYRLKIGTDLQLSLQHKADYDPLSDDGTLTDRATEPLFAHVDRSKYSKCDKAFIALLDNYERKSDQHESVSSSEKREMDHFLDMLDDTPHMRYIHKVLVKWELAPAKLRDFMAQVYEAWFTNYYRGTSSGFEHVFVGEEKKNRNTGRSEIIGLHNWMQFAREEMKGNMDYLGYAKKGSGDGLMITVKFAWKDDDPSIEVKPCSTFLVGSSIAFEFALATLVFFGGKDGDKPWVSIGGNDCAIQLYKVKDRMGEYVRSVYID